MPGGRGAGAAAGGPGRAGPAWTAGGRGPARGRAHRPGLAHCARLLGTLWSPPGGPGDPGQLETERSWAWVLGVGVPRKAGSASTQRFPRRVEAPRLPFRARLGGGAGGRGKFLEEGKVLGRWARLQSGSGVCSGPPRSGRQPQSGCPWGSAPLPRRGVLGVGGRGGHPGSVSSARAWRARGARIAEIGSESGLVFASCGVWRCWQQVPRNPHQTGSGGRGQLPWTDVALRVVWILVTTARAPPGVAGQSPVQPRRPGLAPCGATCWLLLRPLVVQQWDTGRVLPGPSRDSPGAGGDGAVGQTFGRWGRSRRRLPALRHAFPKQHPHPHGCWTGAEGVCPPQRV